MIDHVFMFVEAPEHESVIGSEIANGPEFRDLAALGLVETYRRIHPGQGTRNVCYCFDNLYLELFWVEDVAAVQGDAIKRTGLYERSLWRTNGACPFGIAVRQPQLGPQLGLRSLMPTWNYAPPYLPAGMSIAIALDSADLSQPLLFESPGSTSPSEWPVERRGDLQHKAGLGAVTRVQFTMPASSTPSGALLALAENQIPPLLVGNHAGSPVEDLIGDTGTYRLSMSVASLNGGQDMQIVLPR